MTNQNQNTLDSSVGRTADCKSVGRGFKSHSRDITSNKDNN